MAERDLPGPFCFDCVHYPEAPEDLQESVPDRTIRRNLTAEFFCPWIRRRVAPTYRSLRRIPGSAGRGVRGRG